MPWTPPKSATSFAFRPLDKGMITNIPSQVLPDGAFTVLKNYYGSRVGPKRALGCIPYAGDDTVNYRIEDFKTIWKSDGTQSNILVTSKSLFSVSVGGGFTEKTWTYSTGTISISGVSVTGSGTTWTTNDILPGDILHVGAQEGVISTINTDTSITLEAATITNGSSYSYTIQRTFSPGFVNLVDTSVVEGSLLIADGKRPLIEYRSDGTFDYWMSNASLRPSGLSVIPGCVAWHADRVWIGDTYDATDGRQRQRIRWSDLANNRDFSTTTNWLDLPYTSGNIQRLCPLGQYLVAYFSDAIFVGTPTGYPLAPFLFSQLDTGGIGLVGRHAITPFRAGHLFVGQDDIYYVSGNQITPLDCPILRDSLDQCSYTSYIYAVLDPTHKIVLFGFPRNSTTIETVIIYDYVGQTWSYWDISTTMIAVPAVSFSLDIDSLTGTIDGLDATYPTIDSMGGSDDSRYLYMESTLGLQRYDTTFTTRDTIPFSSELQTKDFDFDDPDRTKNVTRLGIKIEPNVILETTLEFQVTGSTNRGRTWKSLGTIRIPIDHDEGYTTFRLSGSTFRFKLTTSSLASRYSITEMTVRVRGAGSDENLGSQ